MSVRYRPAVVAAALWLATVAGLQSWFVLRRGVAIGDVAPLVSVLHASEGAVGLLVGIVSVLIPVLAVAAVARGVRSPGDHSGMADATNLVLGGALLTGGIAHLWLLADTPSRLSSFELYVVTLGLTLSSVGILAVEAARKYRRAGPAPT